MKNIILIIIYILRCNIPLQSQTLYGLTPFGGSEGWGTVIRFLPATNSLSVVKSFEGFAANPIYTTLIQASDGKLYGMTKFGGNHKAGGGWLGQGGGAIFSFDPSSGAYTKLKNFEGNDGANPEGSLMQAGNGKLYGMTYQGGSNDFGVIFSFDPSTSTYSKLKDFDANSGFHPLSSLTQAGNGKLYGMTTEGGINGNGVVFSFDPATSTYTKLVDFDGSNGGHPEGGLLRASDGKLYGVTKSGGSGGVIFSIDPVTSNFTVLNDFSNTGVSQPNGTLMQASNGKFYGTAAVGALWDLGAIFTFDPSTSIVTKLKDLDYPNGHHPRGSLVQAGDGKLYGMVSQGGPNNRGAIFSFDPSTSTYTKLMNFDGITGGDPYGSFVKAGNGKLYGMTSAGGASGYGVIFSYDPSSSGYAKLKDFEAPGGREPQASLVRAANGKFYGMTPSGGSNDKGVIFSFDPATSTYTKLKDFDGVNGAMPFGSLMQANNGKLYGMTAWGGSNGYGVIFSFDPATSIYTKLKDFDGGTVANPYGSLMQAGNGKLYGMTALGGSNGQSQGTLFSFDPSTSTYTKLKDFGGSDGNTPYGSLMQATNGKLYGMTSELIFSYDPASSTFTKLVNFDGTNGSGSYGSLMQAGNGKLYGMTSTGGASNYGVIFSFDPATSTYAKLKDFSGSDGGNPYGNLMQASDGKLYGMTSNSASGGLYNFLGVIFSFDPSTSTYTKLQDFNIANGGCPYYNAGFIELTAVATGLPGISSSLHGIKVFPNPVANSAVVSFTLDKPGNVALKIVDVDGRIVKVLANGRFNKGQTDLKWNTLEISAGIYFVQFDAGDHSETKKLSVIK